MSPAHPKTLKRTKKPTRRQLGKKADALWSSYIKQRDNFCCQDCGSTTVIQAAHLITRSYRNIRWAPENGVTLCRACHVRFTHRPLEWTDWVNAHFGPDRLSTLKVRALAHAKPDPAVAIEVLQGLLAEAS